MSNFEQTFKNIDDVLWKEAGCSSELDYTEQTSWLLFLKYLDDQVLPELIELKYGTPHDAQDQLGAMTAIRELFIGFQKHLYEEEQAA